MPRTGALTKARALIEATLAHEDRNIYLLQHLDALLAGNRSAWAVPKSMTTDRFLRFLVSQNLIQAHQLIASKYGRRFTRYTWGLPSPYTLALTLSPRAYFSHGTALALHGLAARDDSRLYLNIEQSPKPAPSGHLTQGGIDRAFQRSQRQSEMIYRIIASDVVQLAGKYTDKLGVEEREFAGLGLLATTNPERTLIDCVVRPAYAGGADGLLGAYRQAKGRISSTALAKLLNELDYAYPYHQAIGFLLEQAGHSPEVWERFLVQKAKHKFYLTHAMQTPAFSKRWSLYYPATQSFASAG